MIETVATVIACSKGQVTLQASQRSSCDHCREPECGSGQVNKALHKTLHQITLPYAKSLPEGAQVLLALPEKGLLTAAGLMFLLPLGCLLVGAALGETVLLQLLGLHEIAVALSGVLGGWLGYRLAARWHQRISRSAAMEPKILKVISKSEAIRVKDIRAC